MKPFNLDEALAGKKVVTRDGRPVDIAGQNKNKNGIAGWVHGILGDGCVVCDWYNNGKRLYVASHPDDLFMAPTERKEWIVRFSNQWIAGPYSSLEQAQKATIGISKGATIHEITITE